MKYGEAMDWCEQFTDNLIAVNDDTERRTLGLQAMQKCKEALKKQLPKKPRIYTENEMGICSCKECNWSLIRVQKYCLNCGQKIDWSGMSLSP